MNFIQQLFFYVFVIIFLIGVTANLIGPKAIVDSYKRWGFPRWFRFITAAVEALSVFLVFTPLRIFGYVLAVGVMGSAIIILVINKDFRPIIAPVFTTALIIFLML